MHVQLLAVTPSADRDWLLAHVLGCTRSQLATHDGALTPAQRVMFDRLWMRRELGEPLAYILGEWEFWSLTLKVSPAVLIPRPDTELLVEWGSELIKNLSFPRKRESSPQLADLGTGSGAIALALAREFPRARVVAVDVSPAALEIAHENAQRLGIKNVEFLEADFSAALDSRFCGNDGEVELIVSNPPYIAEGDPHLADLTHEPELALTAGPDGLAHLRTIIAKSLARLAPGGWLLVEHGYDQAAAVRALFEQAGYAQVQTRRDLAGHERATGGQRA